MRTHRLGFLLIALTLCSSEVAMAGKAETPLFPTLITVPSPESQEGESEKIALRCNGTALCEWGVLRIDLYKAALYLEEPSKTAKEVIESDQVKQIRLHFVRRLMRKQMQRAYRASFEANAGEDIGRYRQRIDRFIRLVPEVKRGDCLIFTCFPGQGLEIRLGDRLLGQIPGNDFGRLFVRLYVGSLPPTKEVRRGLLGLPKKTR